MKKIISIVVIIAMFLILGSMVKSYEAPSYDNITLELEKDYTAPSYENISLVLGDEVIYSTSFTVQIAEGYTEINFTSDQRTVTYLMAVGQTDETPIITVTNTGDVDLDVFLNTEKLPIGIKLMAGISNNLTESNEVTNTLKIMKTLSPTNSQETWLWANWTDKVPQHVEKQLNVSVQN